jgi:hypothetical protein
MPSKGCPYAPGPISPRVEAGRDERQDACMALEDLWI